MKTIDAYIVFRYSDGDFQDIYLSKDEADKVCIERNKEIYSVLQNSSEAEYKMQWCKLSENDFLKMRGIIYKVVTLYEAMEDIKDYTQDKVKSQIEEDEAYHEEYPI